jgi:spermidine/putrescine transport system ATP-binding protein
MTAILEATDIVHSYDGVTALEHVSLSLEQGEFLTILGPSGSGKTTLLRVVGGFEMPSSCRALRIGGTDVRGLPPNHRPVATVFQHYALFPHLSVGENVEYGLKVRNVDSATRRARAMEVLRLVRLPDKYHRRIAQLSGGERQRVALARALATQPAVLLLDEPMAALDEKLRREMQHEVRALQRKLGTTFLQVTHSQEEALSMSDRIAVMNAGRIEQLGTPAEIFERPASRFVAQFMGMLNVREGAIGAIDGDLVRLDHASVSMWGCWTGGQSPSLGQSAFIAVHPQKVRFEDGPLRGASTGLNDLPGKISSSTYKGAETEFVIDTDIGPFVAALTQSAAGGGTLRKLAWSPRDCAVGPSELQMQP